MDLKGGFYQISILPEDIEKTDFDTKYGAFEYLDLLLGLCSVQATLQSLMNFIFENVLDSF